MRTVLLLVGYFVLWASSMQAVQWLPWERLPPPLSINLLLYLGQFTWVPVVFAVLGGGGVSASLVWLENVDQRSKGKYFEDVVPRTPENWVIYHQALLTCNAREDWALSSVDAEYVRLTEELAEEQVKAQQDEVALRVKALKEIKGVEQ